MYAYEICENLKKKSVLKNICKPRTSETAASKCIYYTHVLSSLDIMTYCISYNI